ncbi:MAG: hypothetical protein PHV74_13185 [Dehalococcoidia bacterium]|nr:hypothetical protein [Dehalococcoidia bacterium]
MDSYLLEYLALTIGGCLGVYQIAAACGGFKGLRFFKNSRLTCLVGFLILGGTSGWFFSAVDLKMNSNPDDPKIEGLQQLEFFLLGSLIALIITFIISSLANRRTISSDEEAVIGKGLEDLKHRTVFQAFAYRMKHREDR